MEPVVAHLPVWLQQAWDRQLSLSALMQAAQSLEQAGLSKLACLLYQTWLQRGGGAMAHVAWYNLGVLQFAQGDWAGAREAYGQALRIAPDFLPARFNLGLTYERLGQIPAALAEWQWIDALGPPPETDQQEIYKTTLNNLGRVLEDRQHLMRAVEALTRSLLLDPRQADVLHHWIYLREKTCSWPVVAPLPGLDLDNARQAISVLALLSLTDDPQVQLEAARRYVAQRVPPLAAPLPPVPPYHHPRIRVGYCSSDFCLHPVAMLTVELFELHDRDHFEVYGFCWTSVGDSPLRQRLVKAMDFFVPIGHLSDEEAARLIREREIDILIDLQGQTLGARPRLLAYRPAPIQITYLGLPATTAFPWIDYVIADAFVLPPELAPYFTEKPLYMPDVFQVSDRHRQGGPAPTRGECGLPPEGYVFCCFNNPTKITPELFAVWMRILQRVPGSVLWLYADNPWVEIHLRQAAAAGGVCPDRLIFAPHVPPAAYLARYQLADLFLDTFPFNAGTTANDALWMACPVLTLSGRAFASRMAGALLRAAGLPELITWNTADYEERAVALAHDPQTTQSMRAHLQNVRTSGALFDTPRFVRHLEAHFSRLVAELG
ncbi:MAG: TPR domain protein, putative component of TonB system [Candidatus Ozemobacter sibiricus]|jgi:predicted O-linked N-acetylglucosamine transferase (SPINDLY family)|uniref:protein O-GlcNAc transferase n=1 Tax=Candidatus Ozemobacter sibiricus TaxID=2268124 RepID=A0A367ZP73_9BACT|nr:MAG: TPR domain protein, putative component of TonB system [Candidatus Ozemobacter sibiricus]